MDNPKPTARRILFSRGLEIDLGPGAELRMIAVSIPFFKDNREPSARANLVVHSLRQAFRLGAPYGYRVTVGNPDRSVPKEAAPGCPFAGRGLSHEASCVVKE